MFFGILSLLWTVGFLATVYGVAQKIGHINLLDVHQIGQLKWIVPLWALGEVYMFHLFGKRKSAKIVQQAVTDHPFVPVKGFVPNAMPSQGRSMIYTPTPAVSSPTPAPTTQVSAPVSQPMQPVGENPVSVLEKQAVETLTHLAEEKGLTAFPHVLLQNIMIPLTISADIKALLFTFLSKSGTWKVDVKEPVSESVWTNQTTSVPVLKQLLEAKQILSKMEPDAEVVPVILLLDGEIEQEQQIQEILNKNSIHLVRLNSKENSGLLNVAQLLEKEFSEPIEFPEAPLMGDENV